MTMCIRERVDVRPWSEALAANIARVEEIWTESRRASAQGGAVPVRRVFAGRRVLCARRVPVPDLRRARPTGAAGDVPGGAARASVRARMGSGRAGGNDGHRGRRAAHPVSRQAEGRGPRCDGSGARGAARRGSAPRRTARRRCAFAAAAPRISTAARLTGDVVDTRRLRRHHRLRADRARASPRAPARRSPRSRARCARAARCSRSSRRISATAARSAAPSPADCRVRGGPMRAPCGTWCSACACSTASAQDLTFGGRVMKNVAGFDVSRLMTGALGTLGIITEVSLKCLPLPKAETTVAFECSADEAIRRVNEWGGQPLPLSATCFHDGRLRVRLVRRAPGGGRGDAQDRRRRGRRRRRVLGRRARPHASVLRAAARGAARRCGGCRCKSTAPYTDLGGEQLIEWGGALRWLAAGERTDPRQGARVGGRAGRPCDAVPRGRTRTGGVFQPLDATTGSRCTASSRPCSTRSGIFNRGRLPCADALMQTDLAPEYRDTPRGPRSRRDPALVRALRLLHGDVPDVPAAGRRARRTARAHLPHQAGARRRARSPRRRSCTSTAASRAATARRRARRACSTAGCSTSGARSSRPRSAARATEAAQRWTLRRALLSPTLFGGALAMGRAGEGPAAARARRPHPGAASAPARGRRRGTRARCWSWKAACSPR